MVIKGRHGGVSGGYRWFLTISHCQSFGLAVEQAILLAATALNIVRPSFAREKD